MFHENYLEMKEKFKHLFEDNLSMNMTRFEFNLTKYFEDINNKVHNFKQEIIAKVNKFLIFRWIQTIQFGLILQKQ